MPADWARLTVDAQSADPDSTLSVYRRTLAVRRSLEGTLSEHADVEARHDDVLVLTRAGVHGAPGLTCLVNCGRAPATVTDLGEPLVLSAADAVVDGRLAPNAAAWFRG
jgi:alpha-glucosidase